MPYKDKQSEAARASARRNAQRWREKNPERAQAVRKKHYAKHADAQRARALAWYYANKEHVLAMHRISQLRRLYGLTPEQYAALGDACAICGATEDYRMNARTKKKFRLAVDHDHGSKRVRGLLCGNCNCAIGYLKHDPALVRKALEYLERTS